MKVEMFLYEQIRRVRFENGHYIPYADHMLSPTYIGYIEVEEFNEKVIFDLCNWSCYMPEKPAILHSNIECCGHGLLLINPINETMYLSKSIGWLITDDRKIIDKYVEDNRYKLVWS